MTTFTQEKLQPIADKHGIDPATIISIVMALMECFSNREEANRRIKSMGPFERAALRWELRRETNLRPRQITAAVRDIEVLADNASEDDIGRIYGECCYVE